MNQKRKIFTRILISVGIIAAYLVIGNQIVQPDPKGMRLIFLIALGIIISGLVGIINLIYSNFFNKSWINSLVYILTLVSNLSVIYLAITLGDGDTLWALYLCSSIGVFQLILFIKYNFVDKAISLQNKKPA